MHGHLIDAVKTVRVANAQAAGATNYNCSSVDMAQDKGYDSARFVALLGALTATQVTKLKAQGSTDNSNWTDIPGAVTAQAADGDGNKTLIVDVSKEASAGYRYLRPVVLRGTANAVIDGVIAELYRGRAEPITQDTTVSQSVKV